MTGTQVFCLWITAILVGGGVLSIVADAWGRRRGTRTSDDD